MSTEASHLVALVPTHSALQISKLLGLQHPPTDEQACVIESELAPAVVIAGAGSGKTETMAARVVYLIANRLVAPESVLGLTFTRKAAGELAGRVRKRLAQWRFVVEREQLGDADYLAQLRAGRPTVSTYAAYAGRLVAEHALRLGAEPDARLLAPAMAWQLAQSAVRAHAEPLPASIGTPSSLTGYVLSMAGQFADHLVEPADVVAFCQKITAQFEGMPLGKGIRSPRPGETAKFMKSVEDRAALIPLVQAFIAAKRGLRAVDFGDQMRLAAALAEIGEVGATERARFRAVLLDEYQDTGHAQIHMLHGLFGGGHPVTAVGDPFQSIYGWRGASAGNIAVFDRTFLKADGSPADVFTLATSFRNAAAILNVANALAAPLRSEHTAVELQPHVGAAAGKIGVAFCETVVDEAEWIAARMASAWQSTPAGSRTAAVLVRKRAQIQVLAEALRAQGLPVEVVGLGGLISTPEVADVVATLRVLAEHRGATSLVRLLTGARWRIGAADLAALRERAVQLVRPAAQSPASQGQFMEQSREREPPSLLEALDDLGPASAYSVDGYRRLAAFAGELRMLRRRVSAPLPELVAEIERVIGVGIEVLVRPDHLAVGRTHLDKFSEAAASFAAEVEAANLPAFLAYLDAAQEHEHGLASGDVVVEAERIQVLTVHGSKGLEWDIVAVPGLVDGVFPGKGRDDNWTKARQELPASLRGDSDGLPPFTLDGAEDRKQVRDRLRRHNKNLAARHEQEERRLAYVALTRARELLLASGYCWDETKTARVPSVLLTEIREMVEPEQWFEPADGAINPLAQLTRSCAWPIDPLGSADPASDAGDGTMLTRREIVTAAAVQVRAAATQAQAAVSEPTAVSKLVPASGGAERSHATLTEQWHEDVNRLLAERARLQRHQVIEVELPQHLSVSELVELKRNPEELARRIRRPLPRPPAPWARRGTGFHNWLERRWGGQSLLDIDELPGAEDEDAEDTDFLALREAFERSEWADRTPAMVEVPFEMPIDGAVVRGRMDAVFGFSTGGWMVVDWKTGDRPTGEAAEAASIQLAAYRLAWARLNDLPDDQLHRVRAAFHYVRSGETVEPSQLLNADGLRVLIRGPIASKP